MTKQEQESLIKYAAEFDIKVSRWNSDGKRGVTYQDHATTDPERAQIDLLVLSLKVTGGGRRVMSDGIFDCARGFNG